MKHTVILFFVCSLLGVISLQGLAAGVTDFGYENVIRKEKKQNVELFYKSDGTIIKHFKDHDEAFFADGTIIKKYPGGYREVYYKDGRTLLVDEKKGIRTYVSKNGEKRVVRLASMTPFGDIIEPKERTVQKNPVKVTLRYAPSKSDEVLTGEIEAFYNELYDALRARLTRRRYVGKVSLEVVLSYCRFCKTGYCFAREKNVTVVLEKDTHAVANASLKSAYLKDKKKRVTFIRSIIDKLP